MLVHTSRPLFPAPAGGVPRLRSGLPAPSAPGPTPRHSLTELPRCGAQAACEHVSSAKSFLPRVTEVLRRKPALQLFAFSLQPLLMLNNDLE